MPNIQMPNGDVVAFPDDMPREQIKGLIAKKFPDSIPKASQKVDMFDTVADNFNQGATFGLGNRASALLAAGVQSTINGKPFGDNYKRAREVGSQRLASEMEQNPATAVLSNVGGALATGGLLAKTGAGAATSNNIRTGEILGKDLGLAGRIAKGSAAGAASGAAYGAGTAGYDQSLEGAKQGAISGAMVGGAAPVAGAVVSDVYNTGKNAVKGAFVKSPEAIQDAAGALKNKAGGLYDQMRQVGAVFTPKATGDLVLNIETAVNKQKFIPNLNPKTTAIIDDLKTASQNGGLGLDEIDQYRRLLGRVGNTEDGVSAGAAKRALDDFVNNAGATHLQSGTRDAVDLLNKGRSQYAQASKYETIADILAKADGDANKIKSGLKRFLVNNDNKPMGWTDAEIASLKNAASTSGTEALLKMGGKFGIDLGSSLNVGNTIGPAIGYGLGGGVTPIAGTAARQTQKWAARGKAQNLLNTLEGTAKNAPSNPMSTFLSAPAGGAAGVVSGAETRQPITIPTRQNLQNYNNLPEPQVNLPVSPQSNAKPELFDRVIKAESSGNQGAVSPKGAIGIAQIMPRTAPDAARAAGLPYDFKKLQTDPEYNAALGKAYLGKMIDKYGNEAHALIAYNWGPGNTDKWLRSGAKFERLPKETQKYLQKILG